VPIFSDTIILIKKYLEHTQYYSNLVFKLTICLIALSLFELPGGAESYLEARAHA
jgi:hypothetical protein